MKKKVWGNAVWLLFHTLAEKIKPEFVSTELKTIVLHITNICSNLPCPDCQKHSSLIMGQANIAAITASKEALIDFLWRFHNNVNQRNKSALYPKQSLDVYKRANTQNIIRNFITVMTAASNNEKTMLHSFHRDIYIKNLIQYINGNINKYNM